MHKMLRTGIFALVFLLPTSATAAPEHPYVFWNRGELKQIKQRIKTSNWAKRKWEKKPTGRAEKALHDLLDYQLFKNRDAGLRQKKILMKDVRSTPPLGAAQWINVVRYDMLHDLLNQEEKQKINDVFHRYIRHAIFENALFDPEVFNDERNYSRYDDLYYTRTNWLPNITWPRRVSANLMAAALGDKKLIRKTWSQYGSWQWYFDEYLSDGGFYGEEFSKMGSTPGAMIVYCRALEHLGLNELGFGYRGRRGASMRGHIRSLIRLGYPRVKLHSGRPQYPMVTIGDLRRSGSSAKQQWPTFAFQHAIVRGFLKSFGGNVRWRSHGAWGGTQRGDHKQWDGYTDFTPKMMSPFWFEQGHARWPEDGYGYFLAEMRKRGNQKYVPSLYFGIDPVHPDEVSPPPARSWVAPERGLVMLRADESPAYWSSEAPAVSMRLASPYAHSTRDAFSLNGLYAYNRPIYLNRQCSQGYAGGWTRSVRSHAGLMVDAQEPQFTDQTRVRDEYYDQLKFAAATSSSIYDGVRVTRGLFLTDQYLFDLYRAEATDGKQHTFHWFVHGLGTASLDQDWSEPHKLGETLSTFQTARSRTTGSGWSVEMLQNNALKKEDRAFLPDAWYNREVGVRLSMTGAEETTVHVARTPVRDNPEKAPAPSKEPHEYEAGGTSVIVRREAEETTFSALHLPFENGSAPDLQVSEIDSGSSHAAVRINGNAGRDYIMMKWKEKREPVRVSGETLTATFAGHAQIRIRNGDVYGFGDLQSLEIQADLNEPTFYLNNRTTPSEYQNGTFQFHRDQ